MGESRAQSRERVEHVARRALEGAGQWQGTPLDRLKLEAIACGRVPGEQDREFASDASKPLALLRFDSDAIASFVYESSRPPVIAGASALLRKLNEDLADQFRDQTLFSGGGEGLLLLPLNGAAAAGQEIERLFHERTCGALKVAVAWLPVGARDFLALHAAESAPSHGVRLASGTPAVLARLHDRIRRLKDERYPEAGEVAGNQPRCASCRDRSGALPLAYRRPDETGLLCRPCDHRWEVGRREIQGTTFEEVVAEYAQARGEDDAERSPAHQLAMLYADGNGMGTLFGRIDSLSDLRFLSEAVRAVFAALDSRVERELAKWLKRSDSESLPWISLLAGGDEGIWILPAAVALEAAEKLPGWLDKEVKGSGELRDLLLKHRLPGLSLGMGLVICQPNYPVRYQYELARVLQKNAKSLYYGRGEQPPSSSLDFEVLTDASPLSEDLEALRRLVYSTDEPGFSTSCRPYFARGFTELRELLKQAESRKVSGSQVRALAEAAREGEAVFLNFLRYQLGRKGTGEPLQDWLRRSGFEPSDRVQVQAFAVREVAPGARATWLADALEIAPYLIESPTEEEVPDAAA
ncbi:MAG: hypothetical protein U0002_19160 [Thermoanaerobaculia bacterium]